MRPLVRAGWVAGIAAGSALVVGGVVRARALERVRATVGTLDPGQMQRVVSAGGSAFTGALAAFSTDGTTENMASRDTEASHRLDQLRATIDACRAMLAPALAARCQELVDALEFAQVKRMAFAMNRANHGSPDAAQAEIETSARQALDDVARPLVTELQQLLGR